MPNMGNYGWYVVGAIVMIALAVAWAMRDSGPRRCDPFERSRARGPGSLTRRDACLTRDRSSCSSRSSPSSSAFDSRARWPVASRSTTSPVNIAFASEASIVAVAGAHTLVEQALLDVGAPDADLVAAHLAGQAGDGRVERRRFDPEPHDCQVLRAGGDPSPPRPQRSACDRFGRRSSHCASTSCCADSERRSAATIRSSFDPKWCTRALTLTPSWFAIGRSDTFASPCSAR